MDGQATDGLATVNVEDVFELLPSQATLEQAKDFLRRLQLEHSAGSWDAMIGERLRPMHEKGRIGKQELVDFLCEAEEFGRQHVLLFNAKAALLPQLFDEVKLRSILSASARWPALNSRYVVNIPDKPVIAEVRLSKSHHGKCLTIKVVERRHIALTQLAVEYQEDGYFIRKVPTEPYRAANIVCIHENGLCEVRIHSHSEAIDYSIEATALLENLKPLLSASLFSPMTLSGVRDYVWSPEHREAAKTRFSVRASEHIDGSDGRIRPSIADPSRSMLDSPGIVNAIDTFHASNANVLRAHLTLLSGNGLTRGLNIHFSGADNEFFLTAKMTRQEYEYVLKEVLQAYEKMKK